MCLLKEVYYSIDYEDCKLKCLINGLILRNTHEMINIVNINLCRCYHTLHVEIQWRDSIL